MSIYVNVHGLSKLLVIATCSLLVKMAEELSSQIFDPRKYLNHFYSYLNKKPGEEPELLEFILIKIHEYMKEG